MNIDSRLLQQLTIDELGLAIHIAKRMNKERTCFPSIATLSKDTGWSYDKVQRIKGQLEQKKIIQIKKGGGRFANLYTVLTPHLGIYLGGNLTSGQDNHGSTSEIHECSTSEIQGAALGKTSNQVLGDLTINNPIIEHESIEHKKDIFSFHLSNIFESIVKNLYPDYAKVDQFQLISYHFHGTKKLKEEIEAFTALDPTTKLFFEKTWVAAGKIYNAIKTLNRRKLEFVSYGMTSKVHGDGPRLYREKETDNYQKEAIRQIEAYTDFCRLSGQHQVRKIDAVAETIMSSDWCQLLFDFAKIRIDKEQYDPAFDEYLLSYWLLELYYWTGSWETRVCKRYNNRIVDSGREYLINQENEFNHNGYKNKAK